MQPTEFILHLPDWLTRQPIPDLSNDQHKMAWVISLSRQNIAHGGGPFGAAIFEIDTGMLISYGINRVVSDNSSILHAEMVAIMLAQQRLGQYALGQDGKRYELFSSTEPCAMCLGAIPWAGISRLVCAARDEDARQQGFDEGDKPLDWSGCLKQRNIDVVTDLCRAEAVAVLQTYVQQQGIVYNGQISAE